MNNKPLDLRPAFPDMPEEVKQALLRTARAVREDEKVKRFSVRTLALAALIILSTMALAYAAFHSQVAEFFGKRYGEDTQSWLLQGQVATPGDSFTFEDVTFALEEVIYKNKGLYGLIRVNGEKAEQAGVLPNNIGVDEGPLLPIPVVGIDEEKQDDGSVLFAFEISDAMVVGEGKTYTLNLSVQVAGQSTNWEVTVEPKATAEMEDLTKKAEALPPLVSGITPILPQEYEEKGTLPIYQAILRDFGAALDPSLFNQSGIIEQHAYHLVFQDEARLECAPEALFYNEYKGTYNGNYKEKDQPEMILQLPTLSTAAGDLANHYHFGWYQNQTNIGKLTLDKTDLSGLTLKDAQKKVEDLLNKLDLQGYSRVYALDMDIARIKTLGESQNAWIASNVSNAPILDYSKVTSDNEGYYLRYENGIKGDGDFIITAYVTKQGIVSFTARDSYKKGGILTTPEKLISADTIPARLAEEITKSRFADMAVREIISLELTYAPTRAQNKAEGLVFTPAWLIKYYDTDSRAYEAFAIFNAVDGTLISAMFI